MILRDATRHDLDRIMALERRADMLDFIFQSSRAAHEAALEAPDISTLVIEADGVWGGFCMISDLTSGSSKAMLKRIALEHAGQGIGTAAILAIQQHVFEVLCKHRLALDCYTDNERAIRLYEKTGFQREGVLREASVKRTGVRMSLVLFSLLKAEYDALRHAKSGVS